MQSATQGIFISASGLVDVRNSGVANPAQDAILPHVPMKSLKNALMPRGVGAKTSAEALAPLSLDQPDTWRP